CVGVTRSHYERDPSCTCDAMQTVAEEHSGKLRTDCPRQWLRRFNTRRQRNERHSRTSRRHGRTSHLDYATGHRTASHCTSDRISKIMTVRAKIRVVLAEDQEMVMGALAALL